MKTKDIDLMREIRLWIVQIGLPIAGLITVASNPNIITDAKDAINNVINTVRRKV